MAEYYVGPRQQQYGRGDGTSYANAWSGQENIDWGVVGSFSAITFFGPHFPDTGFAKLQILEHDIIIQSCPFDPAIFHNHYLAADGFHGFTLRGLSWFDGGQIRAKASTSVMIDGCIFHDLDPSNTIQIELNRGNYDWKIFGCEICHCGNAIYTRNGVNDPAQRLVVSGCNIHDIATGKWIDEDGHAIGIQGGSGHVIKGNRTFNTGTAICLWADKSVPMTNIVIDNNTVCTCRALKIATGSGIEISGYEPQNAPAGTRSGIKITRNNVQWCEGRGIASNIVNDPITIYKNDVNSCTGKEYDIKGEVVK